MRFDGIRAPTTHPHLTAFQFRSLSAFSVASLMGSPLSEIHETMTSYSDGTTACSAGHADGQEMREASKARSHGPTNWPLSEDATASQGASEGIRSAFEDPEPICWPEPDPDWVRATAAKAAAKKARADEAAARKARGRARRAPLDQASWRVVLGNATEEDVRRVKRAAAARRSYYKRKAERLATAEAEEYRNGIEAYNEFVTSMGLAETRKE